MNVSDMMEALMKRFPDNAEEIGAWKPEFVSRFGKLAPADLRATLDGALKTWVRRYPPKPGEIKIRRAEQSPSGGNNDRRHPLCLTSMDLFGKPMGDGQAADLSEREFREWQDQNGAMFLQRLGHWKRMGSTTDAANALRAARTASAIDEVWDDYRYRRDRGMVVPEPGEVSPAAKAHARAYDAAMTAGAAWPPTSVFQVAPPASPGAAEGHTEGGGEPVV